MTFAELPLQDFEPFWEKKKKESAMYWSLSYPGSVTSRDPRKMHVYVYSHLLEDA